MIVLGCVEFYPKGCTRLVIVMGLRVLLNTHYLIRKILVEAVLDVHVRGVKIKSFFI
jgi:hypothetical protein